MVREQYDSELSMPISKLLISFFILFVQFATPPLSYATTTADTIPNNIFMYHRFDDERYPSTNTTLNQLQEHLEYLTESGFKFIYLKDLIASPQDSKTISITIDDAYQSFYQTGLPVFEKYNVPVTLFLNTSSVGGSENLNWQELRDLLNRGVDIQNHTHSHPHLPDLDESGIRQEIELSQKLMQENLNITPNLFAYPYGEASAAAKNIVSEYFDAAFGQHSGAFSMNDPYFIARFPFNENYGDLNRIKDASIVLPFEDISISPSDPLMTTPTDRFVVDSTNGVEGINCYISDFQGSIDKTIATIENKMLIQLERSPVQGRLRFNCTQVKKGIYWYGFQYYLP